MLYRLFFGMSSSYDSNVGSIFKSPNDAINALKTLVFIIQDLS